MTILLLGLLTALSVMNIAIAAFGPSLGINASTHVSPKSQLLAGVLLAVRGQQR